MRTAARLLTGNAVSVMPSLQQSDILTRSQIRLSTPFGEQQTLHGSSIADLLYLVVKLVRNLTVS